MRYYKNGNRYCISGILFVCILTIGLFFVWTPDAGAYSQYSVSGNATNCRACHGDFRATSYTSPKDGQVWGNLHNIHRTTMLSGDCDVCHGAADTFPVVLDVSAGGSGLPAISCMGCHGRSLDAGHDSVSGGLGAGLRQHHYRAGQTVCANCHTDANPANYTPVGENVKPPYYANPGTGHPNMPTDSCNLIPRATAGSEDFAGSSIGLDSDGNDLYDMADNTCRRNPSRVDFDNDRMNDITVWRPGSGIWYVLLSSGGYNPSLYKAYSWGLPTDNVVPGDYDGDTKTDMAVFRNGSWYILQSSDGYNPALYKTYSWGLPGDIPVPGDYDGDGKTDIAVYRPSARVWYILQSSDGYNPTLHKVYGWGVSGDTPVPGDYDGDGRTDVAQYRPSNGTWHILLSSNGYNPDLAQRHNWGVPGDTPVPGDYDGDMKTDIAVYRSNGIWYILQSSNGYNTTLYKAYSWGLSGDIPVPGDFGDGDMKTDIAVYRNGIWYALLSSNNYNPTLYKAYSWGVAGDKPVSGYK